MQRVLCLIIATLLFVPTANAQKKARRSSSQNLAKIGLACLNFVSASQPAPGASGCFPAAQTESDLSWRVQILPYLGETELALWKKFRLNESWNSPHNLKLVAEMPEVFRSQQSKAAQGSTNYLAVSRADSVILGKGKGIKTTDITDGMSKTIMCVEVDDNRAAIWTKPDDYKWDEDNPTLGLGKMQPGGFVALFADSHTEKIDNQTDKTKIKAMFTRNGGEVIEP